MNRIFRTLWSQALQAWVVTSELAKACGKRGSGRAVGLLLLTPLGAGAADLPSGGTVVSGSGHLSSTGQQLTVDQSSSSLAIDWQSFDIGAGHGVTFHQPSSHAVALNRVVGQDASRILGTLNANGRVFLVNPNGILFGQGASVNVGGLVASTLDISNSDFEQGRYHFKSQSTPKAVINQGSLQAHDGGAVALLGGQVSNQGLIVANGGSVALAAGQAMTLDFAGDGLLSVKVDEATADALAENRELIRANGGQVLLTAHASDALLKTVVNNSGVIEAQTLAERGGKIELLGGFNGGTVQVAGTLDASAPQGGNGGFIETSGAHVQVADSAHITTKAPQGQSGTWLIDPNDFTIAASGGDMTGAAVSTAVQNNNFAIQTATQGTAGGNGDIHVNDAITWNSGNTLTLNAERNINVNAAITAQAANGKVALKYGQASSDGGTADYHLAAPINLHSGQNFSTQKGSAGALTPYTVVNDAATLQAMDSNLSGNYAVGSNIDLSSIANWQPVGRDYDNKFTGRLVGLGHTLSNLKIDRSGDGNVGFFGITNNSLIRDIGLVGGSVLGHSNVGGLAGSTEGGTISNVYATGGVSGTGDSVGGLVGFNSSSKISNSYVTGSVSGNDLVGGLVGYNNSNGSIGDSYATGSISGHSNIGGLVGYNNYIGRISNTYASGSVSGTSSNIGGLLGYDAGGLISNSFYATTKADGTGINNAGARSGSFSGNRYGTGKTWAELTQASTFAFASWDIASTGGSNAVWRLYDGSSTPLLRSFLQRVTLTSTGSKTYDGSFTTGNVTYTSNLGNALDTSKLLGSLVYRSNSKNTGTYRRADGNLTVSGLYSGPQGYDISYADASLVIGKASISAVTGITAKDKTYDRTIDATLNYDSAGFTGRIGSDELNVSTASGAFADKNVGTGKAVSITGLTLGGSDAGNYTLANTNASTTANITPQTLRGITAASKTYDGGTGATVSGALSGIYSGDSVQLGSAQFADKNVGSNKAVSVTLTGSDAGNYQLDSLAANIIAKSITGNITAQDKTYDGSTAATTSGTLNGVIGSDAVTLATTGSFADKNAGTGKTVNVSGVLSGTGAGNYVLGSANTSTTASITAKSITGNITAQDKTYDGSTTATTSGTLNGVIGSDAVTLATTGSFADKNAGTGKTVNVSGVLNGTGAGNYVLGSANTSTTASITAKSITGNITAQDKTYDGSTTATTSGTLNGVIGSDAVTLATTGSFADKNAGTGKTVNVSGVLSGTGAGNYVLGSANTSTTASITPKSITGNITAQDKTYDGSTAATTSGTLNGVIGSDAVTLATTGSFADKNAGTGKAVNVSGVLSGTGAGNYILGSRNATTTASITPKSITGSITAQDKTYDGSTIATTSGTLDDVIGSDAVTLATTGSFADKNAGMGKAVNVSGILSGTGAGNYVLGSANTSTTASITPKSITGNITAEDKTYDGSTAATTSGTLNGVIGSDAVTLATNGSFTDKNAGNSKQVNVSGALSGTDAGNYVLGSSNATTTANIATKAITGSITAQDKSYDGTTSATTAGTLSGVIGSDVVNLATSGSFVDKTAGTGKTVDTSGSLSGADAGNYELAANATTTADITPASLVITAEDASKVAGQSALLEDYSVTGLLTGDAVAQVTLASPGANTAAAPGSYLIVPSAASGLGLGNYLITYQPGTLDVQGLTAPLVAAQEATSASLQEHRASTTQATQAKGDSALRLPPVDAPRSASLSALPGLDVVNRGIRLPEGI